MSKRHPARNSQFRKVIRVVQFFSKEEILKMKYNQPLYPIEPITMARQSKA
jgi:hypothetical protein